MCGVAGAVGCGPGLERAVEEALKSLHHRGPDASGQVFTRAMDGLGHAAIGATRLRILDLAPTADMPMWSADRSVCLAFNGEIYNHAALRDQLHQRGHRFQTRCDTETLLALYQEHAEDIPGMLQRLQGMFAFAIVDVSRGRLLLARDRLGIKPLYVANTAHGDLAFASECRALVRAGFVSGELDPRAIESYLHWGCVQPPLTIFRGIEPLLPGTYLCKQAGEVKVQTWWSPEHIEQRSTTQEAATSELASLSASAAIRHTVSDRPIGIFLSGGVDSGVLATHAANSSAMTALTVTFPDSVAVDEGRAAAELASRLGMPHQSVPTLLREIPNSVCEAVAALDQPSVDGVNSWVICRAARQAGLTVALSGLGGDELFGGYATERRVQRLHRARRFVPSDVRVSTATRLPLGRAARVLSAASHLGGTYHAVRGLYSPWDVQSLLGAADRLEDIPLVQDNVLHSLSIAELRHYLGPRLLADTDSVSMAHSMEVRVPLLDDTLVDWALGLPTRMRLDHGKAMLAASAQVSLPSHKIGFVLPFDEWLRKSLAPLAEEVMLGQSLALGDVLSRGYRQSLWSRFLEHKLHWTRIWGIMSLRLWAEAQIGDR